MSYYKKAAKGIGWLGFLQGIFRFFTIIKFYIIVRVLTAYDFGIFAIASLVLSFFETWTATGVTPFLIQTKKKEDDYISTAWVLSIFRGLVLAICILIVAVPVSLFFNQQKVLPLLFLSSLIPLVKGFANPSAAKFYKNLEFHKEFTLKTVGVFTESLFAILLVIVLKSPIALVYSLLISSTIETILSFLLARPTPKFFFDRKKGSEILHFGKWITFTGIASYLSSGLDSIVVGKMLGPASLGLYQISQKFSLQLLTEGGDIFAKVLFPIFSKISYSKERLRTGFLKVLISVGVSGGIVAMLMFVFTPELVLLFLGREWGSAAGPFRVFVGLGYVSILMGIITALFLSIARQDLTVKITILRTVFLLILIFPLTYKFQVLGASLASLISLLLVYPLAVAYVKKILY